MFSDQMSRIRATNACSLTGSPHYGLIARDGYGGDMPLRRTVARVDVLGRDSARPRYSGQSGSDGRR